MMNVTIELLRVTDKLRLIQAIFQSSNNDPNNRDIDINASAAQGLYRMIDDLICQILEIGDGADEALKDEVPV